MITTYDGYAFARGRDSNSSFGSCSGVCGTGEVCGGVLVGIYALVRGWRTVVVVIGCVQHFGP